MASPPRAAEDGEPNFGFGEPNPAEIDDAGKSLQQFATVLNDHLRGRDFLIGDRLSVADFAVAKFLPKAQKADTAGL